MNSSTRKEHQKIMDTAAIKALAAKITEMVKGGEKTRRDLVGYGRMIGPEAERYVNQALQDNRTTYEIQRNLLDMAGIVPGARLNPTGRITSFSQITDDEFFRALADPAPNSLDAGGPALQGGTRSFKQITDDDFFAGLTNPAEYAGGRK